MAIRAALFLAGALALAGCGNDTQAPGIAQTLAPVAESLVAARRDQQNQFSATRESLAASGFDQPLIVALLESRNLRAGLVPIAQDRGVTVWRAPDGSTVSERGGVLTASRGLGADLYSAEVDTVLQAMRSGQPASYARRLRHLDGLAQIEVTRFDCRLTAEGREVIEVYGRRHTTERFRESCQSGGQYPDAFENTYWMSSDSAIMRRSRQWIGADLGYLTMERMLD